MLLRPADRRVLAKECVTLTLAQPVLQDLCSVLLIVHLLCPSLPATPHKNCCSRKGNKKTGVRVDKYINTRRR